MMKLQWNQLNENFYDCLFDGKVIGQLNRAEDSLWRLEIPGFNIHNFGQYRHDLMEYAEIQFNKQVKEGFRC
jgi:lipoprotein NlpI